MIIKMSIKVSGTGVSKREGEAATQDKHLEKTLGTRETMNRDSPNLSASGVCLVTLTTEHTAVKEGIQVYD